MVNIYDQLSVFDLVDFKIFLTKLEILGSDQDSRKWYSNFLTGRSQYVHIEGMNSETRLVECGTPQGSSSGPLVWLLCMLELPYLMSDRNMSRRQLGEAINSDTS